MVNHYGCGTPNFQKGRRNVKLEDLPEEFIENVNAVLQEYDDKVVERFEIKIEFEDMLIDELNNWVTFAVQSRTKNLAFDLVPDILTGSHDRYMFPFHLLDEKSAAFQDAVATLLKGIPIVRNLTLHVCFQQIEARWLLDNRHSFSNLRHLQLLMNLKTEDANKIHYAVSLIRAAPFIEKLEVHFGCPHHVWFSDKGYVAPHLEQHEYSYLKNMHITGYKGERGQLEFLKDVVENVPALESVTIETTQIYICESSKLSPMRMSHVT
ncbi:Os08g0344700 [Oryza sativa Japonica Group]|uniref:Os08g0344700 protein n=1 Tax=Oryza sativa subsp. japonica TaxID=39947 RepID=A0A0N7KPP9_ORYSJ|nr:Os08g0344700 [Oryza sativa Japonica Group]